MENENITDQTLPNSEDQVQNGLDEIQREMDGEAAVDESKVETPSSEAATLAELSLDEINSTLGKNFSSKDEALKSIKDTFNYVGKKAEDVSKNLKNEGYMTKEEFENALFYRDNPEHAGNQEVLDSIAKAKGIPLAEAAKTESYKKLFEGATNFEKSQSRKSVAETNPRLANVENSRNKVQELVRAGSKEQAGQEAARTVIEALGLE